MKLVTKYFPELNIEIIKKLQEFQEILIENNAKINVVSRKDIENFEERHLLHSMSIAKFIQFKPGTKVIDIGTGGGLPGIPLAIMFPETEFTLIDSRKKKIEATQLIADELNLPNIIIKQIRSNELKGKYDFVTGRAVTAFPTFYESVKHLVGNKDINSIANGILYLKGGDFKEEIKEFEYIELINLNNYINEEFFETKKIIYLPK